MTWQEKQELKECLRKQECRSKSTGLRPSSALGGIKRREAITGLVGHLPCWKRVTLTGLRSSVLVIGLLTLASTSWAGTVTGTASWYSTECCAWNKDPLCPTASGKSLYALEDNETAFVAMWRVPIGERVEVCNLANGLCVKATVLDRGPASRLKRVVDLSKLAFSKIADLETGLINVSVEVLK